MNATSPAHPPSQARPGDTWKAGAGQRTTHAHTIPNRPNRAESAPRPHDITDPRIQAKFPNGMISTVRGVFTYRVNDAGLLTNLRGYWNMDAMQFAKTDKTD